MHSEVERLASLVLNVDHKTNSKACLIGAGSIESTYIISVGSVWSEIYLWGLYLATVLQWPLQATL